jgi:hypothetical protein
MAFDAPRKTLDDIRRELDAEYGEVATLHRPSDVDVADRPPAADAAAVARPVPDPVVTIDYEADRLDAAVVARARAEMQSRRWRGGYIAAGVIGCLIGQLTLLGFMAVIRHRAASYDPSVEAPMERVTAAAPQAATPEPQAARETATTSETSVPRDAPSPPTDVAAPGAASAVPETLAAPSVPPTPPPASVSPAPTPVPVANDPQPPPPRRIVKRPPPAPSRPPVAPAAPPSVSPTPSESRGPIADSENWATLQEEVRAALSQWLAASGRADQSIVSDTVVFLGADGRTARTHVPTRWGGGVVIREQRWERRADGWRIVQDREAWRGEQSSGPSDMRDR